MAEVLRGFDLGRTSLYPTKAFRYDRKTPLEGDYFCLNFGETKAAFLPEQSPRKEGSAAFAKVQTKWTLRVVPKDGDLAVDETALVGPDLWIDPRVRSAFFLSDRLARALQAAKLARWWGLFRCRVLKTSELQVEMINRHNP